MLREERLLSLNAVSLATKVHSNTLKRWEAGSENDFLFNKLARLAAFFGVPWADLIEYVPEPDPEAQQ